MSASNRIAQVIFTNVDAKRSPNKRPGDQVVFYSKDDIDKSEKEEVEKRLADFETKEARGPEGEAMRRDLFFRTSTGRFVVARSIPLEDKDQSGRGGLFFAHALILDEGLFREHLHNNPFELLGRFTFHKSLKDSEKQGGDYQAGTIPSLEWPLKLSPSGSSIPELDTNLLRVLLLIALRGPKGVEAPNRLSGLQFAPERNYQTLCRLFDWLPLSVRARCPFDTCFTGQARTQLPYLFLGLPPGKEPRVPNLVLLPAHQGKLLPHFASPSSGLFESWLAAQLRERPRPERLEAAYQLAECLESGDIDAQSLDPAEQDLFGAMVVRCPAGMQKFQELVKKHVPGEPSSPLWPHLESRLRLWMLEQGVPGIQRLASGLPPMQLLAWLQEHYDQGPPPSEAELAFLTKVLDKTRTSLEREETWQKLLLMRCFWLRDWGTIQNQLTSKLCTPPQDATDRKLRQPIKDRWTWFVDWSFPHFSHSTQVDVYDVSMGPGVGLVFSCDGEDVEHCSEWLKSLMGSWTDLTPRTPGPNGKPPQAWTVCDEWRLTVLNKLLEKYRSRAD